MHTTRPLWRGSGRKKGVAFAQGEGRVGWCVWGGGSCVFAASVWYVSVGRESLFTCAQYFFLWYYSLFFFPFWGEIREGREMCVWVCEVGGEEGYVLLKKEKMKSAFDISPFSLYFAVRGGVCVGHFFFLWLLLEEERRFCGGSFVGLVYSILSTFSFCTLNLVGGVFFSFWGYGERWLEKWREREKKNESEVRLEVDRFYFSLFSIPVFCLYIFLL